MSQEVKDLGIMIVSDEMRPVRVRKTREEVFSLLSDQIKTELKDRISRMDDLPNHHSIRALRRFYWSIGIDPTKTRPSSEALVRRLYRKGLPRINSVVDAGNLASARTLIPVGLYDIDRIEGDPELRLSEQGESFKGIGSKDEILNKGIPVLADGRSVMHLYPHRDCMRTRITEETTNILIITCGVKGIKPKDLDKAIEDVKHYIIDLSE